MTARRLIALWPVFFLSSDSTLRRSARHLTPRTPNANHQSLINVGDLPFSTESFWLHLAVQIRRQDSRAQLAEMDGTSRGCRAFNSTTCRELAFQERRRVRTRLLTNSKVAYYTTDFVFPPPAISVSSSNAAEMRFSLISSKCKCCYVLAVYKTSSG